MSQQSSGDTHFAMQDTTGEKVLDIVNAVLVSTHLYEFDILFYLN